MFSSQRVSLSGILVFLSLILLSCASSQTKAEREKAPDSLIAAFKKAEKIKATQPRAALQQLSQIIDQAPNSEIADDAHIVRGEIYANQKNCEMAIKDFASVYESTFKSPRENESRIKGAQCLNQLNRYDQGLGVIQPVFQNSALPHHLLGAALETRILSAAGMNERLKLTEYLLDGAERHPVASARERFLLQANDLVENRLNEAELSQFGDNVTAGKLRAMALYRLGVLQLEQKNNDAATASFRKVLSVAPQSEYATRAEQYLSQLQARYTVEGKNVGVVLPLSGKTARIGERTLNGIQLAFGSFESKPSPYVIAVVDSEGAPDTARRGVDRLVNEDHVVAILGSVMSKTAQAVATRANELGVPSIGLSQKAGLTDIGPLVFRSAMTSEMLVRSLVDMAMNKMGIRRFATFYPNDAYGVEFTNLFWDEVLSRGGEIRAAQSYTSNENDFRDPVKKLLGTYYMDDRAEEYRGLLKAHNKKLAQRSSRQSGETSVLPPVVDFEAIFIPDSAKAVGQIAPMLAYNDMPSSVRLLGTNIWNQPDFVRRGDRYVENSIFVDALLAQDPAFKESSFFKKFVATFGYEPGLFEVQAYDAAIALRQVLDRGANDRNTVADGLKRLETFNGAFGKITMSPQREFLRPIYELTVQNKKIIPVSNSVVK